MPARLSAFLIWALVAASAVFWGMRLLARSPSPPPRTVPAAESAAPRADLTRLFGAPVAAPQPAVAAAPPIASRFQLTGVVAPRRQGGPGIALIAVDGKTPRAYRVGAPIDGDLVLKSVNHRSVALGPARGDASVVLEMPPLPSPATGSLPPAPAFTPPGGSLTPPASGFTPPLPASPTPVSPVAPPAGVPQQPAMAGSMPGRFGSPEYPPPTGGRNRLPPSSTE